VFSNREQVFTRFNRVAVQIARAMHAADGCRALIAGAFFRPRQRPRIVFEQQDRTLSAATLANRKSLVSPLLVKLAVFLCA
jgi:hypothetical protein